MLPFKYWARPVYVSPTSDPHRLKRPRFTSQTTNGIKPKTLSSKYSSLIRPTLKRWGFMCSIWWLRRATGTLSKKTWMSCLIQCGNLRIKTLIFSITFRGFFLATAAGTKWCWTRRCRYWTKPLCLHPRTPNIKTKSAIKNACLVTTKALIMFSRKRLNTMINTCRHCTGWSSVV